MITMRSDGTRGSVRRVCVRHDAPRRWAGYRSPKRGIVISQIAAAHVP